MVIRMRSHRLIWMVGKKEKSSDLDEKEARMGRSGDYGGGLLQDQEMSNSGEGGSE